MNTEPPRLACQSKRRGFFLFVIGAAIVTLYSVSLGHNFLFDEESIILKNPLIRNFSSIPDVFRHGYFYTGLPAASWNDYYRPLTLLSFMLDFHLWGVNPFGYNLMNALLHFIVSALLYKFLSDMLKNNAAAFLAAFLFAVHPLATEAVTYLASRGDLIGAIFTLSALIFYWHRKRALSFLCCGLALFSKESALLLPVALFFLDVTQSKSSFKDRAGRLSPYFGAGMAYVLFRKFACPVPLGPPENNPVEGLLRVLSMGPAFLSYLQAIVLPEIFQFSLSVEFAGHFTDPKVFLTAGVVLILLAAWALSFRYRGAAFFGMSLFLTGFLPYLEFVHFYPEWAEHYLYIPVMGLVLLFGCLVREVLSSKSKTLKAVFLTGAAALAIFWSLRTWQRNVIYNDAELYFEHLSKSGARYAHFGYQNLGRIALEHGKADQAIVPLKTAERIEPHASVTLNLLALYYLQQDRLKEALSYFEKAYRYEPQNFIYRINSSHVLMRLGRYEEVAGLLGDVQKVLPQYASVYINLLAANELLGQTQKAAEWADRGLKETAAKEWEHATMYMAAARFWYRQGRDDKAREILADLRAKYPHSFWYGDILRLLSGELSPESFSELVDHQYLGFERIADHYILMSHVLLGRRDRIRPFLEAHGPTIEKIAERQPLVKKEVERAKALTL